MNTVPRTSWWATAHVQTDRAAFDAEALKQLAEIQKARFGQLGARPISTEELSR